MKYLYLNSLGLFLALCALAPGSLSAQVGAKRTIGGKVTDQQAKPMEFATVSLLNARDSSLVKTSMTTETGSYQFDNPSNGTYLVMAYVMGYKKTYSKPVTVTETSVQVEDLMMPAETKTLKEVAITAQKPFIERKMDKLVMNVEGSSVSAGSTAMEVLEKAPGVTIDKDDNISMRGKQGVLIMLDGKPTYMSSADVANMLRNMQSNQIESIELITSPSARYDAAGTSGIINIRTKKSKNMGLNGTLTAGGGYGLTSKYSAGTTLNYRQNKVNVFGNYNYGNNGRLNTLDLNREVDYQDTLTRFTQLNNWNNRRYSNSFKGGMDYFINKNHTIGILVNGYANSNREESENSTGRLNNFNQGEDITIRGHNRETYSNMAYNFNYKGTLDTLGREVSVDLDYSRFNGKQDELRDNFYTVIGGPAKNPLFIKNYAPSTIDVKSVKVDYTHPVNKSTRIEAGFKSSWVKTDNDLLLAKLNGSTWMPDPDYTNRFVYDENIYAGYLNFSKDMKNTGIQLGLRAEQTYSEGNSVTRNEVNTRKYLELFPSISISQKISKDHQLGLSYSRRIDRPAYDNLNPFLDFLDEYTYQKGNPFLKPQFTNAFDLSYTYKGSITAGLNYSRTNDAMVTFTRQEDITKRTFAIEENVDRQEIFGLNIYAPVKPTKWWNINNNGQVFHMSFHSTSGTDNLSTGQVAVTYNMDHSFTISKTFSAEASIQYQSPMQYNIFKISSQTVWNAGLRKSFKNNQINLRLNMNDIFNTRQQSLSTTYQNMNLYFTEKGESQIGRISLSYRFGKNEIKPSRRRSTGLEDETGRMKN